MKPIISGVTVQPATSSATTNKAYRFGLTPHAFIGTSFVPPLPLTSMPCTQRAENRKKYD